MKLEYTILEHLNRRDDGHFVDVTFVHEDYDELRRVVGELKGKNLILVDENSGRDFQAFGISNKRVKRIRAKIKLNGKAYFHSLQGIETLKKELQGGKRNWSADSLFSI